MRAYTRYRKKLDSIFERQKTKAIFQCMDPEGNIRNITYGAVNSDILRFERRAIEMGLRPGDRILLLDNHSPTVMQMFLTASYWNFTPVLMDAGLPAAEINSLINTLELSAVFTSIKLCEKLSDMVKNNIPIYNIRDIKHDFPVLWEPEHPLLTESCREENPEAAVIILSSGTTRRMKAAEISYSAFLNSIDQNIRISGIRKDDNMLLAFPLFHISGLASAMTVLFMGNTLMMMDEFHPSQLAGALQVFNPQIFGMVPKVFELMIQKLHKDLRKKNILIQLYYRCGFRISSFFNRKFGMPVVGKILMRPLATALFGKNIRMLPVGASRCNPNTAEALINMGLRWFYVYASTECGVPITAVSEKDHYPCDTVGRVNSVENVDIIINHPDIYGVGEIYVRTNQIMNGYFRDPELTKESFSHGYFKTGDLGYIDRNGYLHLTGRSKETILLQTGKKVSPADLEDVLEQAGFHYESAICGVPDADTGFDQIHVFILDRHFSETEREKIKESVRKIYLEEASHYPINQIHFVSEIPKTAVGKVKRNLLREKALSDISAQSAAGKKKFIRSADYMKIPDTANWALCSDDDLRKWLLTLFTADESEENLDSDMQWRECRGIDSLKIMEIMVAIEEKTGVYIGEDIIKLNTINDISGYIQKRQGRKS